MSEPAVANEAMLEIAVNAAMAGHDLTAFEPVDSADGLPDGYRARCRKCGRTAWVGIADLAYCLLGDGCSERDS